MSATIEKGEPVMWKEFKNWPSKERLEFGLITTLIALGMIAVLAVIFGS